MNNAKQRAGVKDWVDSNFFDGLQEPEKRFERTTVLPRIKHELLDGCTVQELDIEVDTVPAELLELMEHR